MYICPKCGSSKVSTERRIDGNSRCSRCGFQSKTANFTINPSPQGVSVFQSQEMKIVLPIKFKKLHKDAVAPKQGTDGAAGFDLTAVSMKFDEFGEAWSYGSGLAVEIPNGFVGMLFPRSSIYKTGAILCNSVGIIDEDFRGEISAKFAGEQAPYQVGERIGQLVIVPIPQVEYVEVEELSNTERGAGGYGSTGK